jgi:CBS domain-containing protein
MIIRDVMNLAVFSCAADQPLNEAARIMWDLDVGAVPVTDPRTGAVCGIITDRDIAMAAYTRGLPLSEMRVEQVMSREVHCASPDHDVAEAHEIMRRHQVRRVPVLNEGRVLVGFVSLNDLALAAADGAPAGQEEEVARTLAAVSRHRNGAGSTPRVEEDKTRPSQPRFAVTEQAALEANSSTAAGGWFP